MNKLVVASAIAAVAGANIHDRAFYEAKFFDWLQEHKVHVKDGAQFAHFLQNFANNDDLIETHNANKSTYTLGHNEFSHMSWEEFKTYFKLGLGTPNHEPSDSIHLPPQDVSTLATSVDWVSAGKVSSVKNQGNCGSCWAFSATGAIESAHAIAKNTSPTDYSEQQMVSCDNRDSGCNGGLMDNAFTWAKNNGGMCTLAAYPYTSGDTGQTGSCKTTCSITTDAKPSSYTDVTKNSDSALMSALNSKPVSVAIQANQPAFQLYKTGVLTGTCGTNLDHGVLAVGYGTYTDGTDYYKVKNSWGTSWGMSGYVLIERGASQYGGECGILLGPPSYPNM